MPQNSFKKIIGKIHLWLGLGSGLVVFLVSLTGCMYVFQEEIDTLLQAGAFRTVQKKEKAFVSPINIKSKIEASYKDTITYMTASVFTSGDRASIIWVKNKKRKYTAFILNPYSGEIIHTYPYSYNFWAIVLAIHTSLLIPEIGSDVVSIATIIFIVMLISGLILWFPKSKKGYSQRFKVKWNASPKRLNYDLHNVFGFYITWIIIFIAITGLVMSYKWLDKSIYWIATGGESMQEKVQVKSVVKNSTSTNKVEGTLISTIQHYTDLGNYTIQYPYDSTGVYKIILYSNSGSIYNKHDTYFIDQYTGETLKADLWKDKNNGEILSEANYNIHVGAILGIPGKILAFFTSLIATSLPVTGFLIWRGRKKKVKK